MKEALAALAHLLRIKPFDRRVEHEIYDRVFAHHRGEKNFGYPFRNRAEMQRQTEALDVEETLAKIERHIKQMPAAYGDAFRYILHRELSQRLAEFEALAKRRVRPKQVDPRFVATRA